MNANEAAVDYRDREAVVNVSRVFHIRPTRRFVLHDLLTLTTA